MTTHQPQVGDTILAGAAVILTAAWDRERRLDRATGGAGCWGWE